MKAGIENLGADIVCLRGTLGESGDGSSRGSLLRHRGQCLLHIIPNETTRLPCLGQKTAHRQFQVLNKNTYLLRKRSWMRYKTADCLVLKSAVLFRSKFDCFKTADFQNGTK